MFPGEGGGGPGGSGGGAGTGLGGGGDENDIFKSIYYRSFGVDGDFTGNGGYGGDSTGPPGSKEPEKDENGAAFLDAIAAVPGRTFGQPSRQASEGDFWGQIEPYTGAQAPTGSLFAFVGQDVDPYSGVVLGSESPDPFTGTQVMNPFTASGPPARAGRAVSFAAIRRNSLLSSPNLIAALVDPGQDRQLPTYNGDGKKEAGLNELTGDRLREFLQRQAEIDSHLPNYQLPDNRDSLSADPRLASGVATPHQSATTYLSDSGPTPSAVPHNVVPAAAALDWTTQTEWGFTKPKGGVFDPITSLDTGNRLLNVILNKIVLPWRNVLADYENTAFDILASIDNAVEHSAFQQEYHAAQFIFPMEKAFGLGFEVGPAIEYSAARLSTSWSKFSTSPRVLNAALYPVFGSLGVGGISEGALAGGQFDSSAANFQHVVTGGSGDRGIGVFSIDVSKLSPTDLETTINHVRDADLQAGIANGLVRTAVPERSAMTNNSAALARRALNLSGTEVAGHMPDVGGGGNPLGPISGLPSYVNSSLAGQWRRYAPGFTFDGFSLINRVTGEFLYISLGLEHSPVPILGY